MRCPSSQPHSCAEVPGASFILILVSRSSSISMKSGWSRRDSRRTNTPDFTRITPLWIKSWISSSSWGGRLGSALTGFRWITGPPRTDLGPTALLEKGSRHLYIRKSRAMSYLFLAQQTLCSRKVGTTTNLRSLTTTGASQWEIWINLINMTRWRELWRVWEDLQKFAWTTPLASNLLAHLQANSTILSKSKMS